MCAQRYTVVKHKCEETEARQKLNPDWSAQQRRLIARPVTSSFW